MDPVRKAVNEVLTAARYATDGLRYQDRAEVYRRLAMEFKAPSDLPARSPSTSHFAAVGAIFEEAKEQPSE